MDWLPSVILAVCRTKRGSQLLAVWELSCASNIPSACHRHILPGALPVTNTRYKPIKTLSQENRPGIKKNTCIVVCKVCYGVASVAILRNEFNFWNVHEVHHVITLQATRRIHDSMNISENEFIAYFYIFNKYLKYKNIF